MLFHEDELWSNFFYFNGFISNVVRREFQILHYCRVPRSLKSEVSSVTDVCCSVRCRRRCCHHRCRLRIAHYRHTRKILFPLSCRARCITQMILWNPKRYWNIPTRFRFFNIRQRRRSTLYREDAHRNGYNFECVLLKKF